MGGFIEKAAGIGEEAGLGIGVEESGGKGTSLVEAGLEEVSVELSASGAIPAPGGGAEEGGEGVRWRGERGHSLPPNKQSRVWGRHRVESQPFTTRERGLSHQKRRLVGSPGKLSGVTWQIMSNLMRKASFSHCLVGSPGNLSGVTWQIMSNLAGKA